MTISETRERFLREILRHIPAAHIEEIHFFAPIRQAGVEGGVAVVAAQPQATSQERDAGSGTTDPGQQERDGDSGSPAVDVPPSSPAVDVPPSSPAVDVSQVAISPHRYAVYTARYRYVLKGPDRGKWDAQIQVEADAPLITVDAVVRGVQRRSGDAEDPERMSGDEVRAFAEAQSAA